jgi:RNA polymerase sigma-70 factor (ECF subfamily)
VAQNSEAETTREGLTVEQLVRGLKEASDKSEASAYCEELIRRFEPLLRRAWRRAGTSDEYQDFVHDVFVRIFKSLPGLESPKAFPSYLRHTVLSVVVERTRKERRQPPLTDIEGLGGADLENLITAVDNEINTRILVRSYLELLPPQEGTVLALEFLEGWETSRIAEKLGLEPGAVRTAKSRALRRLRKLLLDDASMLEKSLVK